MITLIVAVTFVAVAMTIVAMFIPAIVPAVIAMPVVTVSFIVTVADDHLIPAASVTCVSRPYI